MNYPERNIENSWKKFELTGKIEDYLNYRMMQNKSESDLDSNNHHS